jgi:hypothetical protein
MNDGDALGLPQVIALLPPSGEALHAGGSVTVYGGLMLAFCAC